MIKLFSVGCLAFSLFFVGVCASIAQDEAETRIVEETILSPEGSFQVKIDGRKKRVDVVQEKAAGKPRHLRVRILRQDKRPLEVRLHVTAKQEDPFRYTGRADKWNGSLIGFELEWSFDKKTWKSLGRSLNKLIP